MAGFFFLMSDKNQTVWSTRGP